MLLPLLLNLHIAQHIIPNSTVAPTHHVSISKAFLFFKIFKNIIFQKNFWALSRCPWGFCPSFSNSPTPATYPTFFTPTFELHSHFFLHGTAKRLNSNLIRPSYTTPTDAQPVGPTHTWPTTRPTTRPTTLLEAVEPNLHRNPYTTTLLLL